MGLIFVSEQNKKLKNNDSNTWEKTHFMQSSLHDTVKQFTNTQVLTERAKRRMNQVII